MTTTSDARKRLSEAEHITHPATIPGAVSDAAVEAAARALVRYESSGSCTLGKICGTCDCFLTPESLPEDTLRQKDRAGHILTAALPHLRKDWEAPLRALVADAREDKRIHDVTTARTVGSDHRPCESMARLRFAERLESLLAPEVPE